MNSGSAENVLIASQLLCGGTYVTLAWLLLTHWKRRLPGLALIAACAATGLWALGAAVHTASLVSLGPGAAVLDAVRSSAWLAFLGVAYAEALSDASARAPRWALVAAAAVCVPVVSLEFAGGTRGALAAGSPLLLTTVGGRLVIAVTGLFLVETLLRRARQQGLQHLKHLCFGVGTMLAYDFFIFSEALLFQRVDPLLDAGRAAVGVLAVPFVAAGAARNASWSLELNLSRRAVLHSVTLVAVGVYMFGLASAGTLLRAQGGDWGRTLQAVFLVAMLLLLVVILYSERIRSTLRLRLSRYLFTYRHDYREEWQRFAELLSTGWGASLRARVLTAVAGVVDSPQGGLWLREGEAFVLAAQVDLPSEAGGEPVDGPLASELAASPEGIRELGSENGAQGARQAWFPDWLRRWEAAWLVVPLLHQRSELIGFIVLGQPVPARRLEGEDEELLQTVAQHAASYLAEERATRALSEAQRFEEVSREMAFIAHDIRNLTNDLSLALANARTHIGKPEFQRDLLLSMEDSVAGMRRLLDRLRRPQSDPPAATAIDLTRVIGDSMGSRPSGGEGPAFHVQIEPEPLPVVGDPDRVLAVSGHLVRNAVEAAGPEGRVTVRLCREGDQSLLEVSNDGAGMSREFIREHMLHPFTSSRSRGLGLGLYQCRKLAEELGGQLEIESEPESGTVARLRLPLAEGEGPDWKGEVRHVAG